MTSAPPVRTPRTALADGAPPVQVRPKRRSVTRAIAVAIPARNEEANLPSCLRALAAAAVAAQRPIEVAIFANNCADATAAAARRLDLGSLVSLEVIESELPPGRAHAGWARRIALDAAFARLRDPGDLLLSTDADTLVAPDWLTRTIAIVESGYDAVAGLARLKPCELRGLPRAHRARLAALRRYDAAITRLKALREGNEPWPRHHYEGGASIALTAAVYDQMGGAPTPPVSEDKALFDAVRSVGGRVRHAVDVRVLTSARLVGRAPGGASDTLALWGELDDADPIPGVETIVRNLALRGGEDTRLSFRDLPDETARARSLVRLMRASGDLAAVG